MADHDAHDHTGVPGAGTPADITALPTVETDTALVFAPDGTGHVQARAESGGSLPHAYAEVGTDQSTSSASFTDLATAGPDVTLTVNTKVKVTFSAMIYTADGGRMAVDVSGTTTVAPSDSHAMTVYDASGFETSRVIYFSGLTPGSTTFTAKYKRLDAGTAHFLNREILVECMD